MSRKLHYLVYVFILILLVCSETTISYAQTTKKNKTTVKEEKSVSGPQNVTVFLRKLVVEENHAAKDIVLNHNGFFREVDEYRFDNYVLGYVTPYNRYGYDIAKIFGNKFTHISPVWFNLIKAGTDRHPEIIGTHHIDKEWIAHVKNAGRERHVKIVPRLLFDDWTAVDYEKFITNQEAIDELLETMKKMAVEYGFNGYVIEFWNQVAPAEAFEPMINFSRYLCENLEKDKLQTIFAIPPKLGQDFFGKKHFDQLHDCVAAFSMTSYNFSIPGPNSSVQFLEESIVTLTKNKKKRKKILAGLGFFGYDYSVDSGEIILGGQFVHLLQKHEGMLIFDEENGEHVYDYIDEKGKTHMVFYPTLGSINRRLELLESLNVGVAIWELGQGLDYFYDLF